MSIFTRLGIKARAGSEPTAAQLQHALARAEAEKHRHITELERLRVAYADTLLTGDDATVDQIEAAQKGAARELDRLDAAMEVLTERHRLAVAIEAKTTRNSSLQRLARQAEEAAAAFTVATLAAHEAAERVRAVIAEAAGQGLRTEITRIVTVPPWPFQDDALFVRYRDETARQVAAFRSPPPAPAAVSRPAPTTSKAKPATTLPPLPAAPTPPRVPPPRRAGSQPYAIVKSGVEVAGHQFSAGQVAHLLPAEAEPLLRAGAITSPVEGTPE